MAPLSCGTTKEFLLVRVRVRVTALAADYPREVREDLNWLQPVVEMATSARYQGDRLQDRPREHAVLAKGPRRTSKSSAARMLFSLCRVEVDLIVLG